MKSLQTPAARGNHASRLHIPSNGGEQTDGVTTQVSANLLILVGLKITHFYLYIAQIYSDCHHPSVESLSDPGERSVSYHLGTVVTHHTKP